MNSLLSEAEVLADTEICGQVVSSENPRECKLVAKMIFDINDRS